MVKETFCPMYIDSHAHLFDSDLQPDFEDVLKRAQDAGVEAIVIPGTTPETSEEALRLSDRHDFLFACVGIHPHEALKAAEESVRRIEDLARHPKVVAIGEIGLDYYYDFAPKDVQERVFRRQLELAAERNLPVVIHTRDSIPDALRLVREAISDRPEWNSGENGRVGHRGVFHCFTGTAEEAHRVFETGMTVSYPGIVTFKKSPVLETLKQIGCEHILLETDSPYLTPAPYRGKRNEPSYLPLIAARVAEVVREDPTVVAEQTTKNARKLFALPG